MIQDLEGEIDTEFGTLEDLNVERCSLTKHEAQLKAECTDNEREI